MNKCAIASRIRDVTQDVARRTSFGVGRFACFSPNTTLFYRICSSVQNTSTPHSRVGLSGDGGGGWACGCRQLAHAHGVFNFSAGLLHVLSNLYVLLPNDLRPYPDLTVFLDEVPLLCQISMSFCRILANGFQHWGEG